MGLLSNLATDSSIKEDKDNLGGVPVLESDIYMGTVSMAYITVAKSEALGLVVIAKTPSGETINQTFWMTSGKEKGKKNYYEINGEKRYLPGFNMANAIALLALKKEINQVETEEKMVKVYSADAKAEVPTKVEVLTELIGKTVGFGVQKQTVDKTQKDDAGNYQATGETREQNEVVNIFRESDMKTVTEVRGQVETAEFHTKWLEKYKGVTINKAKGTDGSKGAAGAPKGSAPGGSTKTAKPSTSLFED